MGIFKNQNTFKHNNTSIIKKHKMYKLKNIINILLIFIPTSLCAMERSNQGPFRDINYDSLSNSQQPLKKPHNLASRDKKQANREKEKDSNYNHVPNPISCWGNIWLFWNRIGNMGMELFGRTKMSTTVQETNINFLPNELLWHISDYLSSTDILKLSNTCKEFQQVFNDNFWLRYLSKIPTSHSYLTREGPLSPSHRKLFFSHLWYSEERINLAAKLNHPEASVMQQYGYHINIRSDRKVRTIRKDQYIASSGIIKDINGNIDKEKMDRLKEMDIEQYIINKEIRENRQKIEVERAQRELRIHMNVFMIKAMNPSLSDSQAYMRAYFMPPYH